MSDNELKWFGRFAMITMALMILVPLIWTVVFWNSPLLVLNMALPIFIGAAFVLPALGFIIWRLSQ